MPKLPLVAWLVAAGIVLLLCALCAITVHAVLRRSMRSRVEQWPPRLIIATGVAAAVPWAVVWLAPIRIEMNIRGIVPLIGWIIVALMSFVLLVLLPLAAITSGAIWWAGRSRRRRPVSANDSSLPL